MSGKRIEVRFLETLGHLEKRCLEAREFLHVPLEAMEQVNFYLLKSNNLEISEDVKETFFDSLIQELYLDEVEYKFGKTPSFVAEVSFRPGVTDNPGHAAKEALAVLDINAEVASGSLYFMFGDLTSDQADLVAKDLLGNDLIQKIEIYETKDFYKSKRFSYVSLPEVVIVEPPTCREVSLEVTDAELEKINLDNCLALTLGEMTYIRDYYRKQEVREEREKLGLPYNPTDVELEVLAQTWSEHCKHKIFSGDIDYVEGDIPEGYKKLGNRQINGLYPTFVKGSTKKIEKDRNLDWLISVFSDNAGIVRFDKNIDLCIKAETHNSPSALDPYGGALTGILGVNRDILGCGLGARPIANTDVFCFAPPDMPTDAEKELMPSNLMHPRRIFDGVHQGVEDGGNKSGIPTVNGAIYFDQDYAGKPLVFVGTVGAMPAKLKDGRNSSEKIPSLGDRVVMIGGAIGADGIHGATFSSLELNENSPATAVQIGDPLTQKRASDFLLEAQDLGLYSSVTDNGAGGLSSSVGEMATMTGGVKVDLSLCPVKYPGLMPFELMISESQERMTVAVPEKDMQAFMDLAKRRGVEASDIGDFNNSGKLEVYYGKKIVADLNLHFLHDSLPPMQLEANWDGPRDRKTWIPRDNREDVPENKGSEFFESTLLKLLNTPNIASKEPWVRRYDHEVQGATHIKPFVGKEADGPSDCGVLWLYPHGGEKDNAINIGCGLAPRISLWDPYLMGQYAVDEAVRNVVASGGDIDHLCLLDNFCWPDPVKTKKNPDGDYKMAQLVRTCSGLYDICNNYGTPLVSGKDSMKNDFRGKNHRGEKLTISILPTLLVTAMAKSKITATVTSDFKAEGDLIYLLGEQSVGFAGSEFAELYKVSDEKLPEINLDANKKMYQDYYQACQLGLIKSCHDLSDGGLVTAIAESSMGARLGARVEVDGEQDKVNFLFSEGPGRFLVSVAPESKESFEKHFADVSYKSLGKVTSGDLVEVNMDGEQVLNTSMDKMITAWKRGN
ncbi:MAG: phosphoribosylformylglycinamidine synthase [Epsilonproteobacteria bacterium]|nr:MAG: phosphoribosylformylglycinamidine synthase [Campylobacterota bacterium]RLA63685.1 MAG: phosphoribosylformylglycinamidine synthase [Campylobacterota bacterium]